MAQFLESKRIPPGSAGEIEQPVMGPPSLMGTNLGISASTNKSKREFENVILGAVPEASTFKNTLDVLEEPTSLEAVILNSVEDKILVGVPEITQPTELNWRPEGSSGLEVQFVILPLKLGVIGEIGRF
jgi:hypothetical protein